MVFVDLKKAFDMVDNRVLCNKLKLYGIQQRALSWFKCYLSNRAQRAVVWVAMTIRLEKFKVVFHKGHALDLSYFLSTLAICPKLFRVKCPFTLMTLAYVICPIIFPS